MKLCINFLAFILPAVAFCQTSPADSTQKLNEVVVKAYFNEQPLLRSPSSVSIITPAELDNHSRQSLVSAINTAPGVRMEERSPGSYRLSIRGSLLRSPFGIRNVKMYIDEVPLTDAGGNTYLNSLDSYSIGGITILKGAEASIYGANTGGVLLITPENQYLTDSTALSATVSGGSFGLLHEQLSVQKRLKNYKFNFQQAYQASDGYRQNSGLKRLYSQLYQQWQYRPKAKLKNILLYSDLNYETPGGLTQPQAELNPKAARPATAVAPGAIEQQAGIKNKTFLAGLIHELALSNDFRHVISLSASYTDFKNPFITNYETRYENTLGLRTYLEYHKTYRLWNWKTNIGLETQQTGTDFNNYDNIGGQKGDSQAHDNLQANQSFGFIHSLFQIRDRLTIEASASLNYYKYHYESAFPVQIPENTKKLDPQLMPRLAAAYQIDNNIGLRASVSRGYSPPTIAEVRASDNIINTSLQPEKGWNYETGIRFKSNNDRLYVDANAFHFALEEAIVRRVNANDAEYFLNAGGTTQKGIELQLISWLIPERKNKIVNGLRLRNSYTYSSFSFSDYANDDVNYAGNQLTGVPEHVVVTSLEVDLLSSLSVFGQHNFTSSIPLNDANSFFADKYHLVQLKASWKHKNQKDNYMFETFAGVDNLLNADYSLGNDLNAFGNRYFNPSPGTNFYAGIAINFKK